MSDDGGSLDDRFNASISPHDSVVKAALVQHPPRVLDLAGSVELARSLVLEASRHGAELVVFPETWLTAYPAWVFGRAGWGDPVAREWYQRLLDNSPHLDVQVNNVESDDALAPLRRACQQTGVTVVLGINERPRPSAGSLYNSLVTIDDQGSIANVHRKLVPTHTERIVWAPGDAAGLRVLQRPFGRLGGLICWEHWQPMFRQALHMQDEQVHVAAWPDLSSAHELASRSYAFEGRCFVVAVANMLSISDVPEAMRDSFRAGLDAAQSESEWLFDGGAGVIGPDGDWCAAPVRGEVGVVYAEYDVAAALGLKHDLDVAGHYSRPDLFHLAVDQRRLDPHTSSEP